MKHKLLLLGLLLALNLPAFGQTISGSEASDSVSKERPANWTGGVVPDPFRLLGVFRLSFSVVSVPFVVNPQRPHLSAFRSAQYYPPASYNIPGPICVIQRALRTKDF